MTFMTEGPVVVMVLEREDAIKQWRELMGATNPANAAEGTIRKKFATQHRAQCGPWLGRAGDRRGRDSVLLQYGGIAVTVQAFHRSLVR